MKDKIKPTNAPTNEPIKPKPRNRLKIRPTPAYIPAHKTGFSVITKTRNNAINNITFTINTKYFPLKSTFIKHMKSVNKLIKIHPRFTCLLT